MSNPTTIAAKTVPMAFSTDNITWKNAVCMKVWNMNLDVPTTDEETQCGRLRAEGVKDCQFDFELVINTTPNTGEISGKEILSWWDARTPVYVRVQPGTGLNVQGYGKIYGYKTSGDGSASLYKVSGTFKADGDPTIS
jgi:hypothetical protein